MKTLKEILNEARDSSIAIGHFNVSNLEQLRAIMEAAKVYNASIMIGLSEGERKFFGLKQAVALVKSFKEEYGLPVFLNPDHSHSVESAKMAFDAGFDSVHIDLSSLPFEDNVRGTREVVEYVKSKNPEISIEGELGYLRGESRIQKEAITIKPEDLTMPEEAAEFTGKTGIDRFSGAYGNSHGISLDEPALDIERIKAVRQALPKEVAMVLHGGSGIPDEEIKEAIKAGIVNIHVNTEIRVAYADALRKFLAENLEETTPYKILAPAVKAVKDKVEEKLRLFGNI
ncbi:MAG: Tagatose-bisphosphate aldolase [Parcubacteria group bacterium GW2011_GWB2_40_8]|nr:MAG: Tagatose-bisphosphate aldolase [Parcubacteria group bacterium GW2011_GWF2_40_10]KKR46892.1 MAG: Tagatose-bisphosphate aldolase [Parcubacteria group bacterium GW2011_GWA2_40_143]KKR59655.1 MAG: Tagatose-bisphosphate aldolase [Parcubacteria group bacterium GW2011_GWC2_40_31]KKR75165.1 MAG: Tagatose-bisphosphate aldolase [Parcubacteria group bacterium GW2011_GWB2_40_8]KKR75714.1 MAG: Tagatose-bisphosphate aldolase [Parcubacteria group bacterium GW2011_GWE2_40_8]KKR83308.1 MAG: Tagatose-bi